MNLKTVVLGGIAMYMVMFVVSFPMGIIVHDGLLKATYEETESFWRPELRSDPPDMAALMPRWITTGVLTSMVFAAIYVCVHSALSGPGWKKGLVYGAILGGFTCCFNAGWSGVFDLPGKLWIIWSLESFVYYLPGGAVLGWMHGKFFS